ncbi:MAG: restriction endonuclease subunit S [Sneathiella sp.]|nr:restriction endonuclease subunit S [Sneathiella sp.]
MTDIMTLHEPRGWRLYRLGQLFEERKEKVSDKDFPPLSVTMNGIVPQLETAAKSDDGDNRKFVKVGDYAINSRSDRKGSGGISAHDGSVSLISIVLKPKGVHPRFAHHLLRSRAFQEEFYRWGHGIVADLWTTRYTDMKNIRLLLPDRALQKAIADFLDRETARIDQLIEKKQQLLALLREKREEVISNAVIKGVRPDVPMRHTGIPWLGEVPDHWTVQPIKYLVSRPLTDGPHVTPIKRAEGVPFISAESISGGKINFEKKWGHISVEDHLLYSRSYKPQKHDVLVVKLGATTGRVARVETDIEFNIWVPLAAIRPKNSHLSKFIYYALQSSQVKDAYQILWTYGTQQTLGLGTLSKIRLPIPPDDEIKEIVSHIEKRLLGLDNILKKTLNSLDCLREFRAALITAAVTGQIDVTTWGKQGQTDRRLDEIEEVMQA